MIEIPASKAWTLQSPRLGLTPMVQADAPDLFALPKEPSLHEFSTDPPPASADDVRERIRGWETRRSPTSDELWLNWTLRLGQGGLAVGYVQATVSDDAAELAWVIGAPFQRQGYATEAAQCVAAWILGYFQVAELRASIPLGHTASQRVAAHLGLQPSGELTHEGEELWITRYS
ncbi:MAG: GNAT family N-acetyltransferase [Chloroflexota bacterium]|nr:GNAT family N-acetyltransferase [Chloroflexota bacterium]MDE2970380.1 GNAT family N-acetyltransferase [Chloroflexota bacterium]